MFHLYSKAVTLRLFILATGLAMLVSCSSPEERSLSSGGEDAPALRTAKLIPPAGSDYIRFGHAVATDGEVVVVGAWGHSGEAGAAYVFELTSQGWTQIAQLAASDAASGARFGYSLDVEDGTIAVGALYESSQGRDAGAVYLFERQGSAWNETAKLVPDGEAEYSHFGRSVALDGGLLAVGAPGPAASEVHLFARNSEGWRREAVIASPAASSGTRFGTSVSLSSGTLAIGAWTEIAEANGFVALYERSGSGWEESQRLSSPEAGDRFGYSVSLDGELLAVGAPDAKVEPRLRIFGRGSTTWSELVPVIAAEHSAELGHVVILHQGKLLAGDPAFDGSVSHGGQVLLAGVESGVPASLLPQDLEEGSSFGVSVAASGNLIVVGAVGDRSSGHAAGAAYVYY